MKENSITLYRRLLTYVKPHWVYVVLMLVATAIYSSTNAIYASKLKVIIDEGFIEKDMQAIYATIISLVIITIFRGISFFVSNYTSRRVSSDIVLNMRKDMFSQLQRLPSRYFDRVNSGETLSRFNYDVLQVTDAATNATITLVREGVLVVVLLAYLLYQNWKLTLLIFALTPVIAILVKLISRRLRKLAESIQGNMGSMNHILDENIKGQKIIKIYGGQNYEKKKFTHTIARIRNASIRSEIASSASAPVMELLVILVISLIIWLMAREAKMGGLTPGEFLSYTIMIGLLPNPIKRLMRINEMIQKGLAASRGIFKFLDEVSEESDKNQGQSFAAVKGELDFQSVTFSYQDADSANNTEQKSVLDNFSLHIPAGETVALVGASGSGKSSVVSLLPRFYEVNSGKILLDGEDISKLNLSTLRQQIAFVNQDIILFDDTVIRNIAYGVAEEEIDLDRVKKAAQLAQAEDFILRMEHGYESVIGESGQRLSGGQKQRLAIARAIYKDAPIIILDEATSALDSESEHKVQLALETLIAHRTAIVVAHRLSTIRNADRILVLDEGKIVESGTHDSLIAKKGRYYYLNQSLMK